MTNENVSISISINEGHRLLDLAMRTDPRTIGDFELIAELAATLALAGTKKEK